MKQINEDNKLNINLKALKESQEKKDSFYRVNSDEYRAKLEKIKADREAAKKAIINKVKEQDNNTIIKPQKEITIEKKVEVKKRATKIKDTLSFVKNKRETKPIDIDLAQEKLSYTLQMDKISDVDRRRYRREKQEFAEAKIYDTFSKLDPQLSKFYYIICTSLLFITIVTILIIYFTKK
ncbi:MAG: hypothetical protein LBR40_03735 [Bacilli bacterium]|jgi:hypothetical protein|nr:hypothetical protein [Bacilli bacterium]